eukprot:c15742_g1_i1 orf=261-1487(+)
MVHTSIMTASMAGEEQLVFHDFLGMACHRGDSIKHSELNVLDASLKSKKEHQAKGVEREELAAKAVSTSSGHFDDCSPSIVVSEQLSWPQGNGGTLQAGGLLGLYKSELNNRQAKRRDITNSADFTSQQLQRGMDTPETSPHLKVSRYEKPDDRKSGHVETTDFTHLPMQPPRMSSNLQSLHPSFVIKPGLNMVMSNKWDNSKQVPLNNGMFGPTQVGHLNLHSEKLALRNFRESNVLVPRHPADEGSRTGLKGSSAGILLNSNPSTPLPGANHTNPSPGRSKSWSQSAGSESMYVASQQTTTPTSRQLTIFYGGQAHVFDDVPSDKADAIMTLAGSSGRSWSTMYNPRPKASMRGSGSEGPQSTVDRDKSISKTSAMAGPGLSAPEGPNVGSHSAPPRSSEDQRGDI